MKVPGNIVESQLFLSQKNRLKLNAQRLDEAMEGVVESLCINPLFFPLIPDSVLGLRCIKIDKWPGIEPVRMFYSIEGDTIELTWMEKIETSELEDDIL